MGAPGKSVTVFFCSSGFCVSNEIAKRSQRVRRTVQHATNKSVGSQVLQVWLNIFVGSFKNFAATNSACSFLTITIKKKYSNLKLVAFSLAQVIVVSKNVFYCFSYHQMFNKSLQHQSLRSLDSF